jgi:hypothetical protein
MKNRLLSSGSAVFVALVLVGGLALTAVAQAAPVRIVQGSDGTLYVVQGSNSWTLVPDQIADADVAALSQRGEIDGTLPNELLIVQPPQAAAPAAAQPQPAAPAAPAAPAPAPVAAPAAPVAVSPPTLTILNPTENQNVSAKGSSTYTVTGTVVDPNPGARVVDVVVDIWIFGERNGAGGVDLGNADVQSDGTWSLTFSPTRFTSTHTNIYVYARSKASGKETVQNRGFNIVG